MGGINHFKSIAVLNITTSLHNNTPAENLQNCLHFSHLCLFSFGSVHKQDKIAGNHPAILLHQHFESEIFAVCLILSALWADFFISGSDFDDIEIPERRCRSVFFGLAEAFLPSSLSCTKIERDFSARKRGFGGVFSLFTAVRFPPLFSLSFRRGVSRTLPRSWRRRRVSRACRRVRAACIFPATCSD